MIDEKRCGSGLEDEKSLEKKNERGANARPL
jgi:hypothetical protein